MTTINIYSDGNGSLNQSAVTSVKTPKNGKQSKVIGKTPVKGVKQKNKVGSKANKGQWVNYTNPITAGATIASKVFKPNTIVGKFARRFKF